MAKYEASAPNSSKMKISGDDQSITVTWESASERNRCYSLEVTAAQHSEFFAALKKIAKDGEISYFEKRATFDNALRASGLKGQSATCPSR